MPPDHTETMKRTGDNPNLGKESIVAKKPNPFMKKDKATKGKASKAAKCPDCGKPMKNGKCSCGK